LSKWRDLDSLECRGGQLTLRLGEPIIRFPGIKTYLFSSSGTYLGLSEKTDERGMVSYRVSGGNFKIRADYLGYQFWRENIEVYGDVVSDLAIPHQDVSVIIGGLYDGSAEPRSNLNVYLFTPSESYLGIYGVTDQEGEVIFHLPNRDYKVRVDYLSKPYWSEVFSWTHETITINEGMADITVTNNVAGRRRSGLRVQQHWNPQSRRFDGFPRMVSFRLPEGNYKFRADYMGANTGQE
jgi:hypothetical protein